MPRSTSNAVWKGNLKDGEGRMTVGDGRWEGAYTFASRFEKKGGGTNPEELAAAAHAGCFSMAFSNGLDKAGYTPNSVETKATVTLEMGDAGPRISHILLETEADVPGIDEDTFQEQAEAAKKNCPISKLYAGTDIELDAKLV